MPHGYLYIVNKVKNTLMERAIQLFLVTFILILLTAGVTYRWTLNATDSRIKAVETKFQNLQQVVESRNSATQNEVSSLRRDLEANTEAIRSTMGSEFDALRKQVSTTKQSGQAELSQALQDILAQIEEVQKQSEKVEQKISTVQADNGDFSATIDRAMPATVSITSGPTIGSGFFISEDGLLVTNLHVVSNSADIKVLSHDRVTYRATLLSYDEAADIALLRLNTPRSDFEFLTWADSDRVEIGEPVATIGSPGGQKFSVSKGVISGKESRPGGTHLFQVDISINPGNSGGPVIDATGKVVGIAVGFKEMTLLGLDRIGFAIQSNFAQQKVETMKKSVFTTFD